MSATAGAEGDRPPHVLREYALLADGERGALVGPRGDISWMCLPRWHDDPAFADLLGGPGRYSVTSVATPGAAPTRPAPSSGATGG